METQQPLSATVKIDDQELSYTGEELKLELTAGTHTIAVESPNYVSMTRKVTIKPDEHLRISFYLLKK